MDVSHFGLFDLAAAPPRRVGRAAEANTVPAKEGRTRPPAMQHGPGLLVRLILGQRRHPGKA
jgi:hypothetical protein